MDAARQHLGAGNTVLPGKTPTKDSSTLGPGRR